MHKLIIFLIFVLCLTLPLGSIAEGYYTYDMTGNAKKLLEANPLDRDYNRDMRNPANHTTYGMADVNNKYIKLWDRELNVIYQKLLLKLNDEEKELLIDSQVGWLQHHEKELDFVGKALKKEAGSYFIVQVSSAYRLRLRDRTLQLMEYYRRLGGDVEFEYKGDTE
jgi:uncharacterized protein YecT (DUF1311 family)